MRRRHRASGAVHLVTLAMALTLAGRSANAHELGTTSVTADLESSRFVVEIVCDPASVVARLDAGAGRPRSPRLTIEEYQDRLAALEKEFVRHVDVRFDGRPVHSAIVDIRPADGRVPGSPEDALAFPRIAIRLTGAVPGGSRTFSWSYGLTFVTYAFVVREGGSSVGRLEWLDGAQASQPFDLNGAPLLELPRAILAAVLAVIGCLLLAACAGRASIPIRRSRGPAPG